MVLLAAHAASGGSAAAREPVPAGQSLRPPARAFVNRWRQALSWGLALEDALHDYYDSDFLPDALHCRLNGPISHGEQASHCESFRRLASVD